MLQSVIRCLFNHVEKIHCKEYYYHTQTITVHSEVHREDGTKRNVRSM
jgi:hypothetical protein